MKMLNSLFDLIEKIGLWGSMLATLIMMVLVSSDAILRYFFDRPIYGAMEITQDFLLTGLVLLSISYAYKKGSHVRVTLLLKSIPKWLSNLTEPVLKLVSILYFLLIAVGSWQLVANALEIDELSSGLIKYPLAPSYFLVTLGSILLCGRLLLSIFDKGETVEAGAEEEFS